MPDRLLRGGSGRLPSVPRASTAFNQLVGALDYPMFVVTTADATERAGCLVGFVTQTSIAPTRVLVCLSKANHTTRVAARALWLAVHVLREGDLPFARLFGEITEQRDPVDKFAHCPWRPGPAGVPLLDGIDCFVGRIAVRVPNLGDHIGHLLAVDSRHTIVDPARRRRPQLGYQQVSDLVAGNPAVTEASARDSGIPSRNEPTRPGD